MTNPHIQDRQAPIAGEPATAQPYKNIPPIKGNRAKPSHSNQDQQSSDEMNKKPRRKYLVLFQVIIIALALAMSTYSILLTDSLDDKEGYSIGEGNEVLVRTEGRDADHICSEGGADIFIGMIEIKMVF